AEVVLAGQLAGEQLAHEPLGVVVADHAAAGVKVRPGRGARALGRGANVEVGPLHLVIVGRQRQTAQQVQAHVVLVRLDVEGRHRHQVIALELALFLDRLTGAPGVVVAGDGDDAQVADLGRRAEAARQFQAAVDGRLLTLHQAQRRIDQRAAHRLHFRGREVGQVDLLARAESHVDGAWDLAGVVVEAGPIGIRAVVDEIVARGGLSVAADADLEGQEGLGRGVHGAQVDDPAAELARIVGGIGLLNRHARQDAGGEQVQRHHALQRLGAGQRRAVQQGRGIALAQAAHIDEAAIDDRQAGHAGQGGGGGGIAGALQVLGGQESSHFGALTVLLRDVAAQDDDVAQLGGRGLRHLIRALRIGGQFSAQRHGGGGGGRLCDSLGEREAGRAEYGDEGAAGQQQPVTGQGLVLHVRLPCVGRERLDAQRIGRQAAGPALPPGVRGVLHGADVVGVREGGVDARGLDRGHGGLVGAVDEGQGLVGDGDARGRGGQGRDSLDRVVRTGREDRPRTGGAAGAVGDAAGHEDRVEHRVHAGRVGVGDVQATGQRTGGAGEDRVDHGRLRARVEVGDGVGVGRRVAAHHRPVGDLGLRVVALGQRRRGRGGRELEAGRAAGRVRGALGHDAELGAAAPARVGVEGVVVGAVDDDALQVDVAAEDFDAVVRRVVGLDVFDGGARADAGQGQGLQFVAGRDF
uniref:NAD-specific glutamate dehydrogenase n=1 Tax=Parastrongyloides trichosuri TaxID=131310 RepID=A0A0N4ZLJ2_PARTI